MFFAVEEVELSRSLVREGEARVQRQQDIVFQLKARNLSAHAAEDLLASLEAALARDRAHLDEVVLRLNAIRCGDAVAHGAI